MPVACHDKTLPSYWRFNCSEVDKIESSTPSHAFIEAMYFPHRPRLTATVPRFFLKSAVETKTR